MRTYYVVVFIKVGKVEIACVLNQWSVLAILLFAKNADNENEKCLKNQGVSLYCTLKTKKRIPFLTFTRHYENLRKVPPFS